MKRFLLALIFLPTTLWAQPVTNPCTAPLVATDLSRPGGPVSLYAILEEHAKSEADGTPSVTDYQLVYFKGATQLGTPTTLLKAAFELVPGTADCYASSVIPQPPTGVGEFLFAGLKARRAARLGWKAAESDYAISAPFFGPPMCQSVIGAGSDGSDGPVVTVFYHDLVTSRRNPNGMLVKFEASSNAPINNVSFDLEGDGEPAQTFIMDVGPGFDGRYMRQYGFKPTVNGTWPLLVTVRDIEGFVATARCPGVTVNLDVPLAPSSGGLDVPNSVADGPAPAPVVEVLDPTDAERHPYFFTLGSLPERTALFSLRSQAKLDAVQTGGRDTGEGKKQPVTYDPTVDAARFHFIFANTTDTQMKIPPVRVLGNSVLLSWDTRLSPALAWTKPGDMAMHKAYRLDQNDFPWLSLKLDYQEAGNQKKGVAELIFTLPNAKNLGPGTTRGGKEIPLPRLGSFFVEPNTWTRVWWLIEQVNEPFSHVSLWAADETREPVQLYDRLAFVTPSGGLSRGTFRFEYDTSQELTTTPGEADIWNRNFVIVENVDVAKVKTLLQKPSAK